ncbi:iron(III) transport system permease protein [Palleronia marisminoris]|uniref:Sulfate transport system permease protein CysW n=1 Tax=Palleronia marisminoris TaxID=315423 RepID=A0A1Y5SJH7_9RHOB|nr:iron ABC transporter permease [Palleronia marisminoris]SFG85216.1 iron(III) transport system permease protein [Palleronia marisminoris]SLN42275.1 Sulfate transport system permease protein CysW [Palleronia marisminoris]
MRTRSGGERATLAALAIAAAGLFLLPLGRLFWTGLSRGPGPVAEALASPATRRALWNSLDSAAVSATGALILGTVLAFVIGLTNLRAKGVFVFLLLLPMMIPPHVTAISWIQALGPSSPVLGWLGLAPPIGAAHPLYSREGVILLLTIQHTPLVFLVVLAALRGLPREVSEAARIAGAGPVRLLRRVLLPLLAPSLVAAYALAFVSSLGNFGIPALLGIPGRFITLPVLIWRRLAGYGPSVLADVAVLSMLLAVVAILAVALQSWLQRVMRAGLIGPPQPALRIDLGRARPLWEGALALFIATVLALPLASLVATALVPTYGVPLTFETMTFAHFAEVLFRQSAPSRAFVNSTLIAGAAALILAALAAVVTYFGGRQWRLARTTGSSVATLAEVSYAIPGLVISVAFILVYIRPLPGTGLSLYNTLALILLAYLTAYFAIGLKPVAAAAGQLDPALDDAARVSGAGFGRRMRRIHLPLVAPAAASGAILVFLTAYNEVTVSALLWSRGNETIGTTIFNYEDGGYTTLAAAMSTVTVAATVVLMALLDRFGRRLPPGVVPWRI